MRLEYLGREDGLRDCILKDGSRGHSPTVASQGGVVSHERGTPVGCQEHAMSRYVAIIAKIRVPGLRYLRREDGLRDCLLEDGRRGRLVPALNNGAYS